MAAAIVSVVQPARAGEIGETLQNFISHGHQFLFAINPKTGKIGFAAGTAGEGHLAAFRAAGVPLPPPGNPGNELAVRGFANIVNGKLNFYASPRTVRGFDFNRWFQDFLNGEDGLPLRRLLRTGDFETVINDGQVVSITVDAAGVLKVGIGAPDPAALQRALNNIGPREPVDTPPSCADPSCPAERQRYRQRHPRHWRPDRQQRHAERNGYRQRHPRYWRPDRQRRHAERNGCRQRHPRYWHRRSR